MWGSGLRVLCEGFRFQGKGRRAIQGLNNKVLVFTVQDLRFVV